MMKKNIFFSLLCFLTACRCLEDTTYSSKISFKVFYDKNEISKMLFIDPFKNDTIKMDSTKYQSSFYYVEGKERCENFMIYEATYFNQYHFKSYLEKKSKNELVDKLYINNQIYDFEQIKNFVNYAGDTSKFYVYQVVTNEQDTFWFSGIIVQFNIKNMGRYYLKF